MVDTKREIEFTADLLDYVRRVAIKEAKKNCPDFVIYDDVAQEVVLKLLSKPPKYDPSKGASEKTLIYTAVKYAVLKYADKEFRHAKRFKQSEDRPTAPEPCDDNAPRNPASAQQRENVERRAADLTAKSWSTDDVLDFIDSEESRELCRTLIECDGNLSEAARRIGVSEGTVRYRLRLLAPKLLAAGFNPFSSQE